MRRIEVQILNETKVKAQSTSILTSARCNKCSGSRRTPQCPSRCATSSSHWDAPPTAITAASAVLLLLSTSAPPATWCGNDWKESRREEHKGRPQERHTTATVQSKRSYSEIVDYRRSPILAGEGQGLTEEASRTQLQEDFTVGTFWVCVNKTCFP
jgi:hypothetical protein